MGEFEIASALERTGETLLARVPDGWQQGRGAFGGLVLGILLRAIEASEPDRARATRTLAGDLCGPLVPGEAEVRVRTLRRGSSQSNLQAELIQGGAVVATATAILSPPRTDHAPFAGDPPPPEARWQDTPVFPIGPPVGPVFTAHYEYRSSGALPFVAADPPITHGFIRERRPPARHDAPSIIGLLDAWWPTLFLLDPTPRPVATVSFTAELLVDPASLPADEPLRYRARLVALANGFFVEFRELWHEARPVALNQQTFAIIR